MKLPAEDTLSKGTLATRFPLPSTDAQAMISPFRCTVLLPRSLPESLQREAFTIRAESLHRLARQTSSQQGKPCTWSREQRVLHSLKAVGKGSATIWTAQTSSHQPEMLWVPRGQLAMSRDILIVTSGVGSVLVASCG